MVLGRRRRQRVVESPPSRSPTPPPRRSPTPPPQEEEVDAGNEGVQNIDNVNIWPGMFLNHQDMQHTMIYNYLDRLGWSFFASFSISWYPNLVQEFYLGCRYVTENNLCKLRWTHWGRQITITESDISDIFHLPMRGTKECPQRKWSENWPLNLLDCVQLLNNGRYAPKQNMAYRYNLTGLQKLAFKLVLDKFVPSGSRASDLSYIHCFVTSCIMTGTDMNLPAFIIKNIWKNAKHIQDKGEGVAPYGMLLSHILTIKGVDPEARRYNEVDVVASQMITLKNLSNLHLYMWDGSLYSRWEIYEMFEDVMDAVWKANNCSKPPPPRGWLPRQVRSVMGEASTSAPQHPTQAPPMQIQQEQEDPGASEPSEPPYKNWTNRQMLEAMYGQMMNMQLEQRQDRRERLEYQERERRERQDWQWRQMMYMESISNRLGMSETYDFLYGGYHQDGGVASSSRPENPMDEDPEDRQD